MLACWTSWLRGNSYHEAGQGLVEYSLIIVFVAIALIGALSMVSSPLGSIFSSATSGLAGAIP